MKTIITLTILMTVTSLWAADGLGKNIIYKEKNTELEGYIAETPIKKKSVPGFLIVHDWMGISDDNRREADHLADKGAVALAVDIYGKGVRPTSNEEAAKTAGIYKKDRGLLRERIKAAYKLLLENKKVDPKKIVILGYCFGGMTALDLGRTGADVAGIVSFHGNLDSVEAKDASNIKGKVLILHGAIDPYVPADQVAVFQKEMNDAKKDYQLVKYGGAVHSFTNKKAGSDISKGAAYNPLADARSRKQFDLFIAEVLGI
ncbi:MAG: dienelactone hydrolase family protein [Bdellovibrionaceae bacterium]|nr:dienelactone hydrolase family protein [Pseudobdellovibrionaceae bacterium]